MLESGRKRYGMYSKPLKDWGGRRESNPQRPEPQSGALPVELLPPDLLIITARSAWRQEGGQASGFRLQASGSRTLGSRLPALGSRLSALGSRLSALGSRKITQQHLPVNNKHRSPSCHSEDLQVRRTNCCFARTERQVSIRPLPRSVAWDRLSPRSGSGIGITTQRTWLSAEC